MTLRFLRSKNYRQAACRADKLDMRTKVFLLTGFLFFALCAAGFAQTITVVNGTEGHAYVGTIPVTDVQYDRYLANPGSLKALVLQDFSRMKSVAPGSFVQDVEAFRNDAMVFGYVLFPGREGAPVFQFRIPPASAQSSYAISQAVFVPGLSSDQRYLTFSSFELPQSTEDIVVDRRFVDWLQVPDLRRYSSTHRPIQVVRRTDSRTDTIGLDDSAFWEKAGARIDRFKIVLGQSKLFGMISSFQTISAGTRYILRYYPEAGQANTGTIEIPVQGIGGPVYAWAAGSQTPLVVGQYSLANFSLEAEFDLASLSRFLGFDPASTSTWELSSAFAEAGVYEEFSFGTVRTQEFSSLAE